MSLISGTVVHLTIDRDHTGTVEFPDPEQVPPVAGMVLIFWDATGRATWERTGDLSW